MKIFTVPSGHAIKNLKGIGLIRVPPAFVWAVKSFTGHLLPSHPSDKKKYPRAFTFQIRLNTKSYRLTSILYRLLMLAEKLEDFLVELFQSSFDIYKKTTILFPFLFNSCCVTNYFPLSLSCSLCTSEWGALHTLSLCHWGLERKKSINQ